MFRIFRTSCCISAIVANNFPAVPLSDGYRTGTAVFHFHTGIRFVLIIADDFSVSSCPINRTGMIAPNLSVSLCQSFAALPLRFLFR
jgi:hypothetical protein